MILWEHAVESRLQVYAELTAQWFDRCIGNWFHYRPTELMGVPCRCTYEIFKMYQCTRYIYHNRFSVLLVFGSDKISLELVWRLVKWTITIKSQSGSHAKYLMLFCLWITPKWAAYTAQIRYHQNFTATDIFISSTSN